MAGRSKIETALYESFVKGELNRPVAIKPGKMGLTQSVQVRGQYDDGGAGQLVSALSRLAPELQQMAGQMADRNTIRQQDEAKKQYLSMSMEERKTLAESGQLATYDPVYQAMFSRLWGEDVARKSRDEVMAQIQTGQLKFGSNEELEKHLEERRKSDMENYGGNEYALAGYDTHFQQLRQEASRVNSFMRGKERRDNDLQLVQSQLLGVAEETGGNPAALAKTYEMLQMTGNFTDIEMHQRLSEVAQSLARKGKTAELEALLGTRFSKDEAFGNLSQFLGDNADVLTKTAAATNLQQRREAFEETYTNLRQAAHNGRLAGFIGSKSADPAAIYSWLEKQGGRDLLEPTQIDSLIQMNVNTIERQRAQAERNLVRQQMASMRAALQQNALSQAMQFGRAGVTDQVMVDANGVTQVVSADSLWRQATLHFNQRTAQAVQEGKMTPQQAFVEQLSFYGKGGTNPEWEDKLKYGVSAFGLLQANPNDQNARRVATEALDLYARLKASGVSGLETRHVDGQSRKLLEAAVVAQRMNMDPVDVLNRYMNNPDAPTRVTAQEMLKAGVKEDRLNDALSFAQVLAVGAGMPEKDAIREAKKYVTDYSLRLNGQTVHPITRQLPLEDQQASAERLLKGLGTRFAGKGVQADELVLSAPNAAAGFYEVRLKGAYAPLRDEQGFPVVITKDDLMKEHTAEQERFLVEKSRKAIPTDRGPGFKRGTPIDLSPKHSLGEQIDHVVQNMKPTSGLGKALSEAPTYKDMQNWRPKHAR